MFNIYGYISPNQSLGDPLIFCSAEKACDAAAPQQHIGVVVIDAECSGAFVRLCITAVYGHKRMTSVIEKQ